MTRPGDQITTNEELRPKRPRRSTFLMRAASAIAVAVLAISALTACADPRQVCEQAGGQWVRTGQQTGTRVQYVGQNPIFIPYTRDIYECQGADQ